MSTMREVAVASGVSVKTVSRVFNGDPHVRGETRSRVERVLREMHYVPNALATSFRAGRSPVIGVAVPDIADPFFAAIAKAVEAVAGLRQMSTLVAGLGTDAAREPDTVATLLGRGISGLVIAPITSDHAYLRDWLETPIAFVDRHPVRLRADSFTDDDEAGAYGATAHLAGHGHRRIAFVGDRLDVPTTRDRFAGYRRALAAHGLDAGDDLVVLEGATRPGAAAGVHRLAALPDPPSAIFSSSASCTMTLVPVLRDGRFALIGFGDFPLADVMTPPITVVDQDPARIGALAAERIFERLRHPGRRLRRRTVLPVRLIERGTCGMPSATQPAPASALPRR